MVLRYNICKVCQLFVWIFLLQLSLNCNEANFHAKFSCKIPAPACTIHNECPMALSYKLKKLFTLLRS